MENHMEKGIKIPLRYIGDIVYSKKFYHNNFYINLDATNYFVDLWGLSYSVALFETRAL
jgi:hypothetical protein